MIGTRTIEIVSPPEGGLLKFETMSGREAMGSLFEFDVDVLSATGDIPIPTCWANRSASRRARPRRRAGSTGS